MKTNKQNKYSKIHNAGFALLFASLIGSLVLAIGIAILGVTIKQITLASAGRESQHAFYAADSGVECANYLDRGGGNAACGVAVGGVFAGIGETSICDTNDEDVDNPIIYECLGKDVEFDTPVQEYDSDRGLIYMKNRFVVDDNVEENICIDVTVRKYEDESTTIDSRGYSTCNAGSYNRFERAIRTSN